LSLFSPNDPYSPGLHSAQSTPWLPVWRFSPLYLYFLEVTRLCRPFLDWRRFSCHCPCETPPPCTRIVFPFFSFFSSHSELSASGRSTTVFDVAHLCWLAPQLRHPRQWRLRAVDRLILPPSFFESITPVRDRHPEEVRSLLSFRPAFCSFFFFSPCRSRSS